MVRNFKWAETEKESGTKVKFPFKEKNRKFLGNLINSYKRGTDEGKIITSQTHILQ